MKTKVTTPEDIKRAWHVYDASQYVLGRLASEVAQKLMGKNKPYYAANIDCGDYIVITNAGSIKVTGNKLNDKMYYHHSGYPGGLKTEALKDKLGRDPIKVIELAVWGMLPKNKLRSPRLKRLKVFVGAEHPYAEKLAEQK